MLGDWRLDSKGENEFGIGQSPERFVVNKQRLLPFTDQIITPQFVLVKNHM